MAAMRLAGHGSDVLALSGVPTETALLVSGGQVRDRTWAVHGGLCGEGQRCWLTAWVGGGHA
jgi:hypothetical protein